MKSTHLLDARRGHYAVGAFNVNTYDEMVAITEAAVPFGRPVILMASMSCARFLGVETFPKLIRALDEAYPIQVVSHLDHCTQPELLLQCARAGFDSVMYDGSQLPLEENIRVTAELAQHCRRLDVCLEGELGVIAGEEGPVKSAFSEFTNPDAARRYWQETGVDALAVSIGNCHGWYKGLPQLQFGLLETLIGICDVPLVLHGGTGIPQEDLRHAVDMGICKLNVGTEIRKAYLDALHTYVQENQPGDVRPFVTCLRGHVGRAAAGYLDTLTGTRNG